MSTPAPTQKELVITFSSTEGLSVISLRDIESASVRERKRLFGPSQAEVHIVPRRGCGIVINMSSLTYAELMVEKIARWLEEKAKESGLQ